MADKAEEKALQIYPKRITAGRSGGCAFSYDMNQQLRTGYIKGYHQAKEDLALTWEDARELGIQYVIDKLKAQKGEEV